jgi:hypothetical protein
MATTVETPGTYTHAHTHTHTHTHNTHTHTHTGEAGCHGVLHLMSAEKMKILDVMHTHTLTHTRTHKHTHTHTNKHTNKHTGNRVELRPRTYDVRDV